MQDQYFGDVGDYVKYGLLRTLMRHAGVKAKLGVEEITLDFVKEKLSTMTRKEAFEWLVSFDVPCGPIYEAYEGFDDPHQKAQKTIVEVPHIERATTTTR